MKRFFATLSLIICLTTAASAQQTATEWYNKGLDYNTDSNYTDAANAFEKAIALNKTYAEAYYRAGWTYNELANFTKAIEKLKVAVTLKQNYAFALQELAYAYKETGKYTEALDYLNKAIAAKTDYALAYKVKGDVYIKLKKDAEAVTAYEKAYSLDNELESACYELGYWNNDNQHYEKALEWLTKADDIKHKSKTYNEMGFAYYSLQKNDDAIAAYNNAIGADPLTSVAYKGLGDLYRRNYSPAKIPEAMENYRQAIQNNPSSSGSYYGLGWCFNEMENYDSSIVMLKKALELDNSVAPAYTELGYAQYMKGYNDDAISTFNKSINANPKAAMPVYYKGLVYVAMNDKAKAQTQYDTLKNMDADLAAKLLVKINGL